MSPTDVVPPKVACVPLTLADHERMPHRYVNVVELPCSAEALFDVFEDEHSWPKWAPGIGRVDWTSPKPYGVGTTRTVTFWGGAQVFEQFSDWERGRLLVFTFLGTSEEIWTRFGERYDVEALGADRCRLTWTVSYDPIGGFGKVHPYIRPVMALNFKMYMWRLRRYCARLPR